MAETKAEQIRKKVEGNPKVGLDLANAFHRQTQSAESYQVFLDALFFNAQFNINLGRNRDAIVHLNTIDRITPNHPPEVVERLARMFVAVGDSKRGIELVRSLPTDHPAQKEFILAQADKAVESGGAGRATIPVEWQPAFDGVMHAFQHYQKGKDQEARDALNAIGLTSPFLEWKVLLRGLLAWAVNDDAKALENWKRLDPKRLPFQIAKPHRAMIDPEYRASLSVDDAKKSLSTGDTKRAPILKALQELPKAAATDKLLQWLKEVPRWLGDLRQINPEYVQRLSNIVYWNVVEAANPEAIGKFKSTLSKLPHDPEFDRLTALAARKAGVLDLAFMSWLSYGTWLADNPLKLPKKSLDLLRAMVCFRLANISEELQQEDNELGSIPKEYKNFFTKKTDEDEGFDYWITNPSLEDCLAQAVELAPKWAEPAIKLLKRFQDSKDKKVVALADQLLGQFPEDVEILRGVAATYRNARRYKQAIEVLNKAIALKGLDNQLRNMRDLLCINQARDAIGTKAGPASYLEPIRNSEQPYIRTLTFMVEKVALFIDEKRTTEELLKEVKTEQPADRLFALVAELAQQKLTNKVLKPFKDEFVKSINTITPQQVRSVLTLLHYYKDNDLGYIGLKTHESKMVTAIRKLVTGGKLNEEQMAQLMPFLWETKQISLLRTVSQKGRQSFAKNPYFYFYEAEMSYSTSGGSMFGMEYRIRNLYFNAYKLATEQPDRYSELLKAMQKRREEDHDIELAFRGESRFSGFFGFGGFGPFGPFGGHDDEDDDDE